jgi:hypothetical protein
MDTATEGRSAPALHQTAAASGSFAAILAYREGTNLSGQSRRPSPQGRRQDDFATLAVAPPKSAFGLYKSPPKAMSLVSEYSSSPSVPDSRPMPLSFQPVKGTSVLCGAHSLTPTKPNSRRSAVRIAVR